MTAVEWFFEVLAHNDIIDNKKLCDDENLYNLLYSLKNQAKQMEKEQLVKAWDDGDYAYFYSKETGRDFDNGEEYYNETFGKQ
jgi:hypothetical protein